MRILTLIILTLLFSCKANKKAKNNTNETVEVTPEFTPGPPTMVYKTKKDYQNNVPIILSDDGNQIVSYPDPKDLGIAEDYSTPLMLEKGYLLDNRGINLKVAFLKLTYKEYAALDSTPSLTQLNEWIIDKDPLVELCDCGNRQKFNEPEAQLNKLIKDKALRKKCKVLK